MKCFTRELEQACAKRDTILGDLHEQVRELKDRIYRRMSNLSGAFGNFVSHVTNHTISGGSTPQCSPELQEQLLAARKEAEAMTDPADLLKIVQEWVERIEGEDLQSIPLLRLDKAIEQALMVGEPV